MVKVVGTDSSAVKRCTCKTCSAVLEYTQNEVKRVDGRDYSGGSDGKEYIYCSNCGREVILIAW
jgi:RNase P subunit RPR2